MENFTNIDECLNWLEKNGHIRREMDLGLKRVKMACRLLGHPEQKQKTIHITGTNGKGPTTAFLTSILKNSGLRVGSFTSPHLKNWNERISINGSPISDNDFFIAAFQILDKLKQRVQLTIFEFLTVVSLYYFAEINPVDLVIYEVGLGGKHDATNVILPLVSIITNIDYDHSRYLGDQLEGIAEEKSGIIKLNTPCFTAETRPKTLEILRKKASEERSKLTKVAWPKKFTFNNDLTISFQFPIKKKLLLLKTKMIGQHQVKNACLAIKVAVFLKKKFPTITNDSIQKGIAETFWPHRMELISKSPLLFIDGAHNHAGIKSLIKLITNFFPNQKPIFLVAIMKDKQIDKMLNSLKKVASQIIFTETPSFRNKKTSELKQYNTSKLRKIAENEKAFNYFSSLLSEKTIGVITGSLLFTTYIRKNYLPNLKQNYI